MQTRYIFFSPIELTLMSRCFRVNEVLSKCSYMFTICYFGNKQYSTVQYNLILSYSYIFFTLKFYFTNIVCNHCFVVNYSYVAVDCFIYSQESSALYVQNLYHLMTWSAIQLCVLQSQELFIMVIISSSYNNIFFFRL